MRIWIDESEWIRINFNIYLTIIISQVNSINCVVTIFRKCSVLFSTEEKHGVKSGEGGKFVPHSPARHFKSQTNGRCWCVVSGCTMQSVLSEAKENLLRRFIQRCKWNTSARLHLSHNLWISKIAGNKMKVFCILALNKLLLRQVEERLRDVIIYTFTLHTKGVHYTTDITDYTRHEWCMFCLIEES